VLIKSKSCKDSYSLNSDVWVVSHYCIVGCVVDVTPDNVRLILLFVMLFNNLLRIHPHSCITHRQAQFTIGRGEGDVIN